MCDRLFNLPSCTAEFRNSKQGARGVLDRTEVLLRQCKAILLESNNYASFIMQPSVSFECYAKIIMISLISHSDQLLSVGRLLRSSEPHKTKCVLRCNYAI